MITTNTSAEVRRSHARKTSLPPIDIEAVKAKDLLTLHEVAFLLNLPVRTVSELCKVSPKTGKVRLKTVQEGRGRKVTRRAYERFLATLEEESA